MKKHYSIFLFAVLTFQGINSLAQNIGIGISSPQAKLDVNGTSLFRGNNSNSFTAPLRAGTEFFSGRNSDGTLPPGLSLPDLAFNWGGPGGGYRNFITSRHDQGAGVGNTIEFYINSSNTAAGSVGAGFGNNLQLSVTGTGVGVGTNTPDPSAALEVSNANKGLLLPRLTDTTMVSSPAEGLMIYNKKTKSPSYFDGSNWMSVDNSNAALNPQDSIVFILSNSNTAGLSNGTYKAFTAEDFGSAVYATSSNPPDMNTITLSKYFDATSVGFKRLMATKGINSGTLEVLIFNRGSTTIPYYSFKVTSWYTLEFHTSVSALDGKLIENYKLTGQSIAFKNWTTNSSFTYTPAANQVTSSY